jgi:translation initiation factor 2B subunit (eIF-2B alpha/beta/delta family)
MPRPNRGYQNLIETINRDRLSGASQLSRKAAEVITLFSKETKAKTTQGYCQTLLKVGKELISAQPDLIPIFNLVNSILWVVEEHKDTLSLEELNHLVRKKSEEFYRNSIKSLEKIADIGGTLIFNGCKIVTYSSSEAVFSILKKAKKKRKKFKVVLSESRPLHEGRNLAENLGKLGIPVTLVIDVALSLFLKEADLILVGADSISEKSFVNKVGTLSLSLLAKGFGVPFYVVSERTKFISQKWRKSLHNGADPKEVFPGKLRNVRIENPYFEQIPLENCTKIITPEGFLLPSQISSVVRKTRLSQNLKRSLKDF